MVLRIAIAFCVACSFEHGALPGSDPEAGVVNGDGNVITDGSAGDGGACAFSAWNAPQPITELNTLGLEARPRLSPDELSVIFYSDRLGDRDIFTATRTALGQPFSTPALLPGINTTATDRDPALTPDGLQLFFASDRYGTLDIFTATRASSSGTFSAPQAIAALNTTSNHDYFLSLSHDGLTIFFSANRTGGTGTHDVWYSTRATLTAAFTNPALLGGVNSTTYNDHCTAISLDGRELYLSQTVPGGEIDIFVATRPDTSSTFGAPVRVAELSFTGEDHPGWLSRDGLRFYYSHQSTGDSSIYMATRTCD